MRVTVLGPEAIILAAAAGCLLLDTLGVRMSRAWTPAVCAAAAAVAVVIELAVGAGVGTLFHTGYGDGFSQDRFALFAKSAVLVATTLMLLVADWSVESRRAAPLTLVAAFGAMVAASATDLFGLFTGLELAAGAGVVCVGLTNRLAALRLLLAQAAIAGLLGFGMALTYGITGFTRLVDIQRVMGLEPVSLPVGIAAVLAIAALVGMMLLAPLQLRPAAAPASIGIALVGCLGAGAAAIVLLKLVATMAAVSAAWAPVLAVLAGALMLLGSARALASRSVGDDAVFAAASVQGGWVAASALADYRVGLTAGLFLLGAYLAATAAVPALAGRSAAAARAGTAIGLLSLAGAPPLAGWFGQAAVAIELARAGWFWLLAVALLASLLTLVAAVRAVRALFLEDLPVLAATVRPGLPATLGAVAVALLLVAYGVFANPVHGLAFQGAAALGVAR